MTLSNASRAAAMSPARAVFSTRSSSSASPRAPIVAAAPRYTWAAFAISTPLPPATAPASAASRSGAWRTNVSTIEYNACSAQRRAESFQVDGWREVGRRRDRRGRRALHRPFDHSEQLVGLERLGEILRHAV